MIATTTPRIRSISLSKYTQVAQGLGVDPLHMLRRVGLDHSCLHSPDLLVPENAFAELLEVSSAQVGDAALGLLMGACWRLSDFGHISLALQHQASMQQLLQTLKEYQHLISSTVAMETVQQGSLAVVQLHLSTERDEPGRHPIELGITAVLSLCRHQLGKSWNPQSVHFSHAAPRSQLHHRRILGCEIVFNSDFDGIVITTEDLQRLHPGHDHAMEQHARFFLDTLQPQHSLPCVTQQVRTTLQSLLPHGRHNITHVSAALGLTTRSLQRQLEGSGTSFQETLDQVRSQAATRALRSRRLAISDAASLCGFSETSSFTRWFSKNFQQSPSQWRQQAHCNQAMPNAG